MIQPRISALVLVKNDEYWLPYALEASRGFFQRYVIYDVGSTDRTVDIINWFVESMKGKAEFFVRGMPHCEPRVQGAFRNAMIAEARSDYYFILDADEIYTPEGYQSVINCSLKLEAAHENNPEMIYGVVPRVEIAENLKQAYGLDNTVSHHRVYHRSAVFTGPHPGEAPLYQLKEHREVWHMDFPCYHFHNTARSSKDAEVPKRIARRARGTYHPGDLSDFDLFEILPLLKTRIEDFPVNPRLEEMQNV